MSEKANKRNKSIPNNATTFPACSSIPDMPNWISKSYLYDCLNGAFIRGILCVVTGGLGSPVAHHGEGVVLGVRLVGGPQVHRHVVDAGQHLGRRVPLGQLLGRAASCRGTGALGHTATPEDCIVCCPALGWAKFILSWFTERTDDRWTAVMTVYSNLCIC